MEAHRRNISRHTVETVFRDPQQVIPLRPGREVRQSIDETGYLVRVIVDIDVTPNLIVTVYQTSNVTKYWRGRP